jgi:tetratricopeptide (TPR) repeat protein
MPPTPAEELQAATAADKAGDYPTAAKLFQNFLDKVKPAQMNPQANSEVRTRLATIYFLLHEYRESLRTVTPLTSAKGSSVPVPQQAWMVQGLDELELNQLTEAIRALREALKLNPASGTARLALGDALAREGNLTAAVDQYKEQLRRTPNEVEAWYKLGLAYTFLTKQTSAGFWERYPDDPVGQQLKAEGSISRAAYPEALRTLFAMLKQDTPPAGLYADLGTALLDLGFPQTAEPQFQKELKRDPHSPDALWGLSAVMALRGDWDGARENLRSLAESNPQELSRLFESSPPILLRQAIQQKQITIPIQFAQTPEGAAWSNWLQESDVDLSALNAAPAKTCSEALGPPQLAPGTWLTVACYRTLADRLHKQKGTGQSDLAKLAEAELREGSLDDAEAAARRALASKPSDGWAMYWLVKSYEALGYAAFGQVSRLSPNSARLHQIVAKYYADKHETAHAVAEYEAAIKLSPDLPDLHLGLGTVYWEAGDWDQAEAPLRKALDLSPSLVNASYELGDVYIQRRQWEQALPYLQPAVGNAMLNYQACLDVSKAEAGLGHTQQAIDYLVRVAGQDQDGEIHYRLALLYRKQGYSAKADAAFAASNQLRQASSQHGQDVLQTMEKERQALDQTEH